MVAPEVVQISQAAFLKLYKGNIIPLRVVGKFTSQYHGTVITVLAFLVAGLTWVIHDYCEFW